MRKPPRSVNDLLRSPPQTLASVLRRAAFLQEIEAVVRDGLPAGARGQVRVAACDERGLVLHVANGGWATRLRYQQNAIRRALAQRMRRDVPRIDIRVRPMAAPTPPRRPPRRLSDGARAQIGATARCVADNPGLAAALRRLADTAG